jgi:DNA-directed RNA polymerase specialized sigma24 family protein
LVVADRSRGVLGNASRGLVADIDKQLAKLNGKLAPHEPRIAERERLQAARDALTAEGRPKITREDVAAYLVEHGESRPAVIAKAFGVPVETISTHLYRGKHTLFVSREKGWDVRKRPAKSQAGENAK